MSHINLYDAENVADLLKGVYPVMISQYDYGEPLPTATDRVMKEYICKSVERSKKYFSAGIDYPFEWFSRRRILGCRIF